MKKNIKKYMLYSVFFGKWQKVSIYTRLEFDDPKQQAPTEVTCYLSFNNREYANVEFGNKKSCVRCVLPRLIDPGLRSKCSTEQSKD